MVKRIDMGIIEWNSIETDELPLLFRDVIFWHKENGKIMMGKTTIQGVMVNGNVFSCSHWVYAPEVPIV